jgi:hypothetical protein
VTNYKGLSVVNSPAGDLGQALTNNFSTLADRIGVCNYTTTDPLASSDNTLGYSVGSRWINTTSGNEYVCTSAATGAAVWGRTSNQLGRILAAACGYALT